MMAILSNFTTSLRSFKTSPSYSKLFVVQNIITTKIQSRKQDLTKTLKLSEGQTALISEPSSNLRYIKLSFANGIARIYGSLGNKYLEMTLGFCGNNENQYLRIPQDTSLLLEGMTNCLLSISYLEGVNIQEDHMMQWLLDLHIIRHPVGADSRIYALFCLLIKHFGIIQKESYVLPFSMGHSLIAELIGSTRSTVTRQLSKLRKNNHLISGELESIYVLSKTFIDSH